LAACDALTRQKADIQSEDYHRALAGELYEALLGHEGERFSPGDLLGFLNLAENWGAKLAKYKEDDSKSKAAAIGRFLKKFRLKSYERGRIGACSKASSYLRSEALSVLSSVTPVSTAASAALTAAFSASAVTGGEQIDLSAACGTSAVAADFAAVSAADTSVQPKPVTRKNMSASPTKDRLI
jgi:hypothetical protein